MSGPYSTGLLSLKKFEFIAYISKLGYFTCKSVLSISLKTGRFINIEFTTPTTQTELSGGGPLCVLSYLIQYPALATYGQVCTEVFFDPTLFTHLRDLLCLCDY